MPGFKIRVHLEFSPYVLNPVESRAADVCETLVAQTVLSAVSPTGSRRVGIVGELSRCTLKYWAHLGDSPRNGSGSGGTSHPVAQLVSPAGLWLAHSQPANAHGRQPPNLNWKIFESSWV